jgi:hypothetical protein
MPILKLAGHRTDYETYGKYLRKGRKQRIFFKLSIVLCSVYSVSLFPYVP